MGGQPLASRVNSFASNAAGYDPDLSGKPSLLQMVERAATVDGLSEFDLTHPDHGGANQVDVAQAVRDAGLSVSGPALRYDTNPGCKRGAFTRRDPTVRHEAIP